MKRSRGRKDNNHKALAKRAEELGCSVIDLSNLPEAGCDFLALRESRIFLVEVKSEGKENDLTENEIRTRMKCLERGVSYNVISNELQLCMMLGLPYRELEVESRI